MKRNSSNHNAQDSWRLTYFTREGCVKRTYLTAGTLKIEKMPSKSLIKVSSVDFSKIPKMLQFTFSVCIKLTEKEK